MSRIVGALLAFGLACLAARPARAGSNPGVEVVTSGDDSELVKTLPISKQRGGKERVVMSIPGQRVGRLGAGSAIEVSAEVQVTTCLKANRRHPGARDKCQGKPYGFNPNVEAQLVLAASRDATEGVAVAPPAQLTCAQDHPIRNHHCVLAIPWTRWDVAPEGLACNPNCHLNLVMSSWHRKARKGNLLVVGADSRGPVLQDKGRINLVRFADATAPKPSPIETTKPRTKSLPIAPDGGKARPRVVYSARIDRPRTGDRFVVDARVVTRIGSVNYNVELPTQVIVATGPGQTSGGNGVAVYTYPSGEISELNGVNCTQKRSAHSTPCVRDKFGVVTIDRDSRRGRAIDELYVNVIQSAEAKVTDQRWRPDDRARIGAGYLRVWRY